MSGIVQGGGWIEHNSVGKPKARLFTMLSAVWVAVSLIASIPFWLDNWPPSFSDMEWLGILLMIPQLIFIVLAVVFALTEPPRGIKTRIPNPRHDIRKLY